MPRQGEHGWGTLPGAIGQNHGDDPFGIDDLAVDDVRHRQRAPRFCYQRDTDPGAHQAQSRRRTADRVDMLRREPDSRHEVRHVSREDPIFLKLRHDEGLVGQGPDLKSLDVKRFGQAVIGWQCEQQPFLLGDRSRDTVGITLSFSILVSSKLWNMRGERRSETIDSVGRDSPHVERIRLR
jgi:hypothetical protein